MLLREKAKKESKVWYAFFMRKWLAAAHGWGNKHEWLLLLLVAVIVLRIPSLVTPHYYGDEEIYLVMGRAWRMGVPLYQAMFDHKPPLIYILAGIFPTIAAFRGMLLLMMMGHTVLFWKLSKLFWGEKNRNLAKWSSGIFVLLSSWPLIEGLIVNAELLMMLPITASLVMIWPNRKYGWKKYLLAGLVAGIGWLYKIPVMFDAIALALYLFIFRADTLGKSLRNIFSGGMIAYLGGFVLPLLMTFGYYFAKGHGNDYLGTVLTMNVGYVSSWSTSSYAFNPFQSGLVVRGTILAIFTLLIYLFRKRMDRRVVLAAIWVSFAWFGALLSSRPYPHYLQELIPAVALLIPTLFVAKRIWEWIVWAILLGITIWTQWTVGFWGYPTWSVYQNFGQLITRQITLTEYRNRFDNTQRNYAIATYLNDRLTSKDEIFVWGSDATIYNLTNRLPTGGKYIVSFHVHDLKKYNYTMENLRRNKPKAVVVLQDAGDFPAMEEWLAQEYREGWQDGANTVYWKIPEEL